MEIDTTRCVTGVLRAVLGEKLLCLFLWRGLSNLTPALLTPVRVGAARASVRVSVDTTKVELDVMMR